MKKKILILILVFSVFVVGLCFGVNTYAWDESDNYEGSPIANGSEFLNCSISFPSIAYGAGEYWYSNPSGNLFSLRYSCVIYDDEDNERNLTRTVNIGVLSYTDLNDVSHKYFGIYSSFDEQDYNLYLTFNVYYYVDDEPVYINVVADEDSSNGYFTYYPILDLIGYDGLNDTESMTYYIEYTGYYYNPNHPNNAVTTDPYVYNLSAKTNFVYQSYNMLYLNSFNYFEPMGTQIGDVISDTFSLGTGILGAIASYFNVFALTDGNLSWIAVFGFALLGISLCIGMTRWISSLIRRKI